MIGFFDSESHRENGNAEKIIKIRAANAKRFSRTRMNSFVLLFVLNKTNNRKKHTLRIL